METGVSIAYTVRALDAGPIIAYDKVEVDDFIKVYHFFCLEMVNAEVLFIILYTSFVVEHFLQ